MSDRVSPKKLYLLCAFENKSKISTLTIFYSFTTKHTIIAVVHPPWVITFLCSGKYDDDHHGLSLNNVILDFGECGFRCIRSSFFLFNLFFFTAGLTILLLGVWLNLTSKQAALDYASLSALSMYIQGPTYLIAVGVVTLLLTMMGCCGIRAGSICLLVLYAVFLTLVLALQLGAIGLTYIYKDKVDSTLTHGFTTSLHGYEEQGDDKLSRVIDSVQTSFSCCGSNSYADWSNTRYGHAHKHQVPKTCCAGTYTDGCNADVVHNAEMINTVGCYKQLKKYLLENLHVINGFAVWIGVMETLGILFAIIFMIKIRKERRTMRGDETYYELAKEEWLDWVVYLLFIHGVLVLWKFRYFLKRKFVEFSLFTWCQKCRWVWVRNLIISTSLVVRHFWPYFLTTKWKNEKEFIPLLP